MTVRHLEFEPGVVIPQGEEQASTVRMAFLRNLSKARELPAGNHEVGKRTESSKTVKHTIRVYKNGTGYYVPRRSPLVLRDNEGLPKDIKRGLRMPKHADIVLLTDPSFIQGHVVLREMLVYTPGPSPTTFLPQESQTPVDTVSNLVRTTGKGNLTLLK